MCKSRLNKINVIKPAIIAKGIKLISAKNNPIKSPVKKKRILLYKKNKQNNFTSIEIENFILTK